MSSIVEPPNSFQPYEIESSSFISTQPNARTEVEEIRQLLHIPNIPLAPSIDWPPIGISPINEYNTKGLLSMAFPTLFPTCASMLKYDDVFVTSKCIHLYISCIVPRCLFQEVSIM